MTPFWPTLPGALLILLIGAMAGFAAAILRAHAYGINYGRVEEGDE